VAELVAVRTTDEPFARPAGFDLQQAWHTWCERIRQDQGRYTVLARVSPQMHVDLPLVLGEHLSSKQNGDAEEPAPTAGPEVDWVPVTLHFDSLEEARTKLLGLGAGVEVMTPVALRRSLLDYAQQVVKRYSRH
jgi:predicted DNA-binding transcriptional regulator YafY